MRYFPFLAQIFHLSLPKIWQAHPIINYFFQKYMERQIIPETSFSSNFETLTGIRTFGHFQSFLAKFGSKETPLCKSVAMETW